MAIPPYQQFMLPELKYLADGEARSRQDIFEAMKTAVNLTPEDQTEMLPSGKTATYKSRAAWALVYMHQAAIIDRVKRGVYRINKRGKSLLDEKLTEITTKTLERFPEYQEFKSRSQVSKPSAPKSSADTDNEDSQDSPEEMIEAGALAIRAQLAEELLTTLKSVDPTRFEQIVVDVLSAMGYGGGREGASRAVGQTADGGIDGVIDEDRLGLNSIYIQAKRWEGNVGRPIVQAFAGALQGHNASKGVIITTSDYASTATEYVRNLSTKIVLINGKKLAEFMIDYNVGVSEQRRYVLKQLDSDYFED